MCNILLCQFGIAGLEERVAMKNGVN